MKRRDFLKVGGVGLAATAVAAPAIAQSNPEIKWRYTASWPKALDTLYGGCEFFAKRVAEITDNKFQIQPFAAPRSITTGARTRPSPSARRCHSVSTRARIFPGCVSAAAWTCSTIC
jgi:TRAP-type mannitol/chloroaromatic compound transport system substrate-binding protein